MLVGTSAVQGSFSLDEGLLGGVAELRETVGRVVELDRGRQGE